MNQTMHRNPTEVDPHAFHNRQSPLITQELGRKILFSPQVEQDVSFFTSINQLVMSGNKSLKTEQVLQIKNDTHARKRELLQQKRELWQRQLIEESDINETFTTTKHKHFTQTSPSKNDLAATTSMRQKNTTELGGFMRFSNSDFQKSGLRGKTTIY